MQAIIGERTPIEIKSVYISGPMSAAPLSNFPAFDEVAAEFRAAIPPVEVFSPADHDRELGYDPLAKGSEYDTDWTPAMLDDAASWDFESIKKADAIYMLPGWEYSWGARAEHACAVWLKKVILYHPAPSGWAVHH